MKSIMHSKAAGTCYLCELLGIRRYNRVLQEHHVIFGTANRKLSEKYGLKVYLCLEHHEQGPNAVHRNADMNMLLREEAQRAFEARWPELSFREIFGKNYI